MNSLNYLQIPNSRARNTLIGAILFKFGTGSVLLWGQLNLYYISYFYENDKNFKLSQMMIFLNISLIFIAIGSVISVNVAEYMSYTRLIKLSAIMQSLSLILSSQTQNFYSFTFFYIFINAIFFSLSTIPVINSVWQEFPYDSGKTTGILLFSHNLGSIFMGIFAYYMFNPNNLLAQIEYQETKNGQIIYLFDSQVTQNYEQALIYLGLYCGICTIIGSWLISYEEQGSPKLLEETQQNDVIKLNNIEQLQIEEFDEQKKKKYFTLSRKQAIMTNPFLINYTIIFFISFYSFFQSSNIKIYGAIKQIDDQFLTGVGIVSTIVSSLLNVIFWGPLIDRIRFKDLIWKIVIGYGVLGTSFPQISGNKYLFCLWVILFYSLSQGMYTIIGPAFIRYFGLQLGKQLSALKSSATFFSLLFTPLCFYLAMNYTNFDFIYTVLGIFNLIVAIISTQIEQDYIGNK